MRRKSGLLFQESLEERVQELEQALQAERIAAQRDRATITKLQRQINKVCRTNLFPIYYIIYYNYNIVCTSNEITSQCVYVIHGSLEYIYMYWV